MHTTYLGWLGDVGEVEVLIHPQRHLRQHGWDVFFVVKQNNRPVLTSSRDTHTHTNTRTYLNTKTQDNAYERPVASSLETQYFRKSNNNNSSNKNLSGQMIRCTSYMCKKQGTWKSDDYHINLQKRFWYCPTKERFDRFTICNRDNPLRIRWDGSILCILQRLYTCAQK